MSTGGGSTAVVHLVRAANGIAPFAAFLDSYAAHPAGLDHDLVLLYKGFGDDAAARVACRELAAGRAAAEVHVSDEGLDLTAYLAAARQLEHTRLCFLNSYSTILAPRWLVLLSAALDAPGTGLVGATGSWGSHRSFATYLLRLPGPYAAVLDDRAALAPAFRSVGASPQLPRWRMRLKALVDIPREIYGYAPFPAPHVRTNAFMLERELLLSLSAGPLKRKSAAYRFEGGTRGLTAQVRARGLEALLVGRDGSALAPDAWPDADLFWQRDQAGLLIADNQTRAYVDGTPAERRALSRYAWGDRAQPD